MADPRNYRRPAFPQRPWIAGKLYDDLARPSILHLDAYVVEAQGALKYLELLWHEGGRKLIARDVYLIENDGLTPLWDTKHLLGVPVYWTRHNAAWMCRLHARVVAEARRLSVGSRWARVVVQCHYVHVRDVDVETYANAYRTPARYQTKARLAAAASVPKLPDWL